MTIKKNNQTASQKLAKRYGPLKIGSVLRLHRQGDKMTQFEMAKRLGVTQRELREIENNRLLPLVSFVRKAALVFGSSPKSFERILKEQIKREKPNKLIKFQATATQFLSMIQAVSRNKTLPDES